ncbi:DUF2510 domain-containing protein [Yinghuangia aomiensis]
MTGNLEQGWYPDPAGVPHRLRWWDGSAWTGRTKDEAGPEDGLGPGADALVPAAARIPAAETAAAPPRAPIALGRPGPVRGRGAGPGTPEGRHRNRRRRPRRGVGDRRLLLGRARQEQRRHDDRARGGGPAIGPSRAAARGARRGSRPLRPHPEARMPRPSRSPRGSSPAGGWTRSPGARRGTPQAGIPRRWPDPCPGPPTAAAARCSRATAASPPTARCSTPPRASR